MRIIQAYEKGVINWANWYAKKLHNEIGVTTTNHGFSKGPT
jgi:hypothetical protein